MEVEWFEGGERSNEDCEWCYCVGVSWTCSKSPEDVSSPEGSDCALETSGVKHGTHLSSGEGKSLPHKEQ